MTNTQAVCVTALIFALIVSQPAFADETPANGSPWEKYNLSVAWFFTDMNTNVRFGSGVGLDIDAEKLLGMESTNAVLRLDGHWRFSQNRRHRLDLSWFTIRRQANRTVLEDFEIEDENGNKIPIPAGSHVDSYLNIDIYQLAYSYSFFQDDRIDLAAQIGVYVAPIGFGFTASGIVDENESKRVTAPLPIVGFRGDFAIAPKWYLRSGTQVFYLAIDDFKGTMLDARAAVEYLPWDHVGVGLGFDFFQFQIESDGSGDYPLVDFNGSARFQYSGLMLYGKVYF